MASKIEDLDKAITEVNDKLEEYVENGEEWDKIFNQSIVIDQVMIKYLNEKKKLNETQKRLMKENYEKLQLANKDELISQIKQDVKNEYPEVKDNDLEYFSTNVYIYAALTVLGAEKQDIINQLMFVNNRYIQTHIEDTMKDKAVNNDDYTITKVDFKYLKDLNNKYTKMIKEQM